MKILASCLLMWIGVLIEVLAMNRESHGVLLYAGQLAVLSGVLLMVAVAVP
jgi:hypothetical protein